MDQIKDSFKKVKKDMFQLEEENFLLRRHLIETRDVLSQLCDAVKRMERHIEILRDRANFSPEWYHSQSQTDNRQTTDTSTQKAFFRPLNEEKRLFSIGNEGASTDRQQTDNRHVNTQTQGFQGKTTILGSEKEDYNPLQKIIEKFAQPSKEEPKEGLEQEIASLEESAREIKKNFEKLTSQEFKVFVMLANLEEKHGFADYQGLACSLNLTESSIRDYIQRLIRKGIPVEKIKENNKNISLTISKRLKKVVSLPTILNFRKDLD